MMMNQELATSDLNLAAALSALGNELIGIDKTDRRRVRFIFRKTQETEAAIQDYWDNTLKLPAQTLLNAQKALKTRIYSDV